MRHLQKTLLVILGLFLSVSFVKAQYGGMGLKTAVVMYRMNCNGMCHMTMGCYDNYGKDKLYVTSFMGNEVGILMKDGMCYFINYTDKTYISVNCPGGIDFNALTPDIIAKYDVEAKGTSNFLDKNCTIYEAEIPMVMMPWFTIFNTMKTVYTAKQKGNMSTSMMSMMGEQMSSDELMTCMPMKCKPRMEKMDNMSTEEMMEMWMGKGQGMKGKGHKGKKMETELVAWVYQGIPLKMMKEVNDKVLFSMVATSIKENPDMKADCMSVPSDFTKLNDDVMNMIKAGCSKMDENMQMKSKGKK